MQVKDILMLAPLNNYNNKLNVNLTMTEKVKKLANNDSKVNAPTLAQSEQLNSK